MTESFFNASMEARKGAMKMKIVRSFIAFVVVSLFIGIGTAFNGQNYPQENDSQINKNVEKVETKEIEEEVSMELVENEIMEEETQGEVKTENSFSASKKEGTTSNNVQTVTKTEISTTDDNTVQTEQSTESKNVENNTKQEELQNNSPTDNSNKDEQFNAMYYSITKGNPEYQTLSDCNSIGDKIKNKELDEILDWNENNPDNFKQPTIKAHWCYEVMKDGKIYYFLHFITETGANMDEELKRLYK